MNRDREKQVVGAIILVAVIAFGCLWYFLAKVVYALLITVVVVVIGVFVYYLVGAKKCRDSAAPQVARHEDKSSTTMSNDEIRRIVVEHTNSVIRKEVPPVVVGLRNQLQTMGRDMASMQQTIHLLKQKVQELSMKVESMQYAITNQNAEPQTSNSVSFPKIYYALAVDSNEPLGFRVDNLKRSEDGCVFKIALTDDLQGHYEIVNNQSIQQEVLTVFNPVITDSSVYDCVPLNSSSISVVQPGTVVKEGNILKIVNKQRIKIT